MKTYNKYDVACKIAYVENYLKLCANGNHYSLRQYCLENNLPKTTFYDWLNKYKNEQFNKEDKPISLTSNKPTFIELTRDDSTPVVVNKFSTNNSIKLSYKDITLEFSDNELDKVMEIIKRW